MAYKFIGATIDRYIYSIYVFIISWLLALTNISVHLQCEIIPFTGGCGFLVFG